MDQVGEEATLLHEKDESTVDHLLEEAGKSGSNRDGAKRTGTRWRLCFIDRHIDLDDWRLVHS